MKRIQYVVALCGVTLTIVLAALLQSGCEQATGLNGLQVDPSSATLTTNGQTTVFTVTGGITNETLALPLSWRVSDEALGRITYSSGYSGVYQRTEVNGSNTIIVRDQYDNEGFATVQQSAVAYSLELSASATSITNGQSVTITVTTASAQAPFRWRLLSGPERLIAGSGSSAAYSAEAVGTAVIEAEDANGATGVIAIEVKDIVIDTGGGGGGGSGGA